MIPVLQSHAFVNPVLPQQVPSAWYSIIPLRSSSEMKSLDSTWAGLWLPGPMQVDFHYAQSTHLQVLGGWLVEKMQEHYTTPHSYCCLLIHF